MLCCVFDLFVFVLCLVYPMLPISLDCPLLISTSVFSNVYYIMFYSIMCMLNILMLLGYIRIILIDINNYIVNSTISQ